MIARMKFLKISAPGNMLDLVINNYISKHEFQLENAVAELEKVHNMVVHNEANPYKEYLAIANEYVGEYEAYAGGNEEFMSPDDAVGLIKEYSLKIAEFDKEKDLILQEYKRLKEISDNMAPFSQIQFELQKFLDFKFINYRFGRIPKQYYKKLCDFAEEDMCSVFCECSTDDEYVWGVYFVPATELKKVEAVYSSMYFENIDIDSEYEGTAEKICNDTRSILKKYELKIAEYDKKKKDYLEQKSRGLFAAKKALADACRNYDIRKQAAFVKSGEEEYFIICGWMPEEEFDQFKAEIKGNSDIIVSSEDDHKGLFGGPPVKLKNPKILKPFEMLIKMYGMPDYHEMDPTWFVAISYTIIFGMMFGDVGQGICLAIGGFLLYKIKKMDLAAIIGVAGIFSTIFGFLFGSVFGYEELIEPLWMKPTEAMADLPFIGKLNTIFVFAIALGMVLILVMMVFNIVNSIKAGNFKEALFDHNGVSGIVFYGSVIACAALFMTGRTLPGAIVLVIMFIIPLLLMALKEPLMAIVFKHKESMPEQAGVFAIQAFFEMFEVLLSYFSNTLSFVRIGGFAVSHASMMGVVLMLAGAENGGTGNLLVIILGNILVCGLEGLIVGIQVMRLEYYEMFSRFYRGGGREFKPFKEKTNY